jgi:hypothetical protein
MLRRSLLALLLLGTACGEASSGKEARVVDGHRVFVADIPECDDMGACAEAYVIDGVTYESLTSCVAEKPSELGDLIAMIDGSRMTRFFASTVEDEVVGQVRRPDESCEWQPMRISASP